MRFTSNAAAFSILSSVALLTFITPVVYAHPARFTNPQHGDIVHVFDSLTIKWIVDENERNELDGVKCDIDLQQQNPSISSPSLLTLVTDVAILDGQAGPVEILSWPSSPDYHMRLISPDKTIIYAEVVFTILLERR